MSNEGFDVVVVAPTGLAAYNINGLTIHRVFKLPVQQGDKERYYDLMDGDVKMLRHLMKNLRLIIIGKFSILIFERSFFILTKISKTKSQWSAQ